MPNLQQSSSEDQAAIHAGSKSLFRRANFGEDKTALGSGAVTFLLVLAAGLLTLDFVYGEAATRPVAAAVQASALYLASTLIAASVTIIALMLNALGTTRSMDAEFDRQTFLRIYRIIVYATLLLTGALVLALLLCLPVQELSGVPDNWYGIYYRVLVGFIALASGLIAMTTVELYRTTYTIISKVMDEKLAG